MAAPHLLSEHYRVAINHMASYELHISDAYLCMACYYIDVIEDSQEEDTEKGKTKGPSESLFAAFFEDQAEVKREHGKQFLRYLRRRESKICLPVIKRPEMDTWEMGVKALESALEMENHLSQLLLDLMLMANEDNEYDLLSFMGKFLDKQKRNTEEDKQKLERQLVYHRRLEKQAQVGKTH